MKYYFLLLCFLLINNVTSSRKFFLGRKKGGNILDNPVRSRNIEEKWFEQKLDHFDPTVTKTWQQLYFVNDLVYNQSSKAAFLFIGGEGSASSRWMEYGSWYTSAIEYGAILFQLEHRYYGSSQPTDDLSLPNLKYLTSHQALADLAEFITAMNIEYNLPKDVNWIVFGGSYSGSLAAWARVQYPHLIKGAMSASGPLLAKLDFFEYLKVVGNSLSTHSNKCVQSVKDGIEQVEELLSHGKDGADTVTALFNLCTPIGDALNNTDDIASFYETIADNFAGVVQYNLLTTPSINDVCDIMVDDALGEPIARLGKVNILINGEECLDFSYKSMVNLMQNETYSDEMWRQWTYQTCTEFGFFQTSSYETHVFGDQFPIEFFVKLCQDVFGENFNNEYLNNAINQSNILYGGKNIKTSNVVFVHGTIDPWSALGVTETVDEEAPAIFIEGTAHCANMYPPMSSDPPGLNDARKKVHELIGIWLGLK